METQNHKIPSAFDYNISLENLNRMSPDGLFYLFRRWNEDSPEGRKKLVEKSQEFKDFCVAFIPGEVQQQFNPTWQHLTIALLVCMRELWTNL